VIPQQQLQVVEQQIIWQQDIMVEPSPTAINSSCESKARDLSHRDTARLRLQIQPANGRCTKKRIAGISKTDSDVSWSG
jgi:hypothetical protein